MRGDSLRYCLFYDEKENLIGFGIDCAPSDGMREVSREEYFNITGDPRAAKEPEPTPDPIEKLEQENALLKQQVQALTEQAAFHEEIFVELAEVIYA